MIAFLGRIAIVAAVFSALVAGCGGGGGGAGSGQPSNWAGTTEYDAASQARSAISDEALDPKSTAYGKKLLVGDGTADRLPGDGRQAWRIGFTTLDGATSDLCMWVWVSKSTPLRETFTYSVGTCPVAVSS